MNKIILVSGPIIVESGKALLNISGEDNFWKFCGGRVRDGESLAEAAIRRAKEELGINVNIINNAPFLLYKEKDMPDGRIDIILAHFLAEKAGDIVPGPDVLEWQWIDIKNLPENIGPNIKPALKYFKFL